jgi:MFS family permease
MRLKLAPAPLLVTVSLVEGFGSSTMMLAGGVWVMALTGSASLAALTGMFIYLPSLLGPVIGSVADRLPRRELLIVVNLGLAAVLLLLLTVRGARDIWLIFAVTAVFGLGFVLISAAETAILPSVMSGDQLGKVNGWRTSAREGMKLVAPLAGAALFAWRGGQPVVLITVAALAVAALLYSLLPTASGAPVERGTGQARYLVTHPLLRKLALTAGACVALSGLAGGATYDLVSALGRPPEFMGVLASAQGLGSIVGGIAGGWLMTQLGEARLSAVGAGLFGLGTLWRCIAWEPTVVAAGVLIGVGLPLTVIAAYTAIQRHAPAGILGGVAGTAGTVIFAPVALALPIGAAVIAFASFPAVLASVAVLALLTGAYAWLR